MTQPLSLKALEEKLFTQFALPDYSQHGPSHWNRVKQIGLALAEHLPEADQMVITYFALFHDACRQDKAYDPEHGKRASDLVKDYQAKGYICLTQNQLEQLCFACTYHAEGETSDDPTIGACWDADRLDLSRVGGFYFEDAFSTAKAKEPEFKHWALSLFKSDPSWRMCKVMLHELKDKLVSIPVEDRAKEVKTALIFNYMALGGKYDLDYLLGLIDYAIELSPNLQEEQQEIRRALPFQTYYRGVSASSPEQALERLYRPFWTSDYDAAIYYAYKWQNLSITAGYLNPFMPEGYQHQLSKETEQLYIAYATVPADAPKLCITHLKLEPELGLKVKDAINQKQDIKTILTSEDLRDSSLELVLDPRKIRLDKLEVFMPDPKHYQDLFQKYEAFKMTKELILL